MDFSWQFLLSSLTIAFLLTLTSAQDSPLYHFCIDSSGNFTTNSTYERNRNNIISFFSSNKANDYGFYNFSSGQGSSKVNAIARCKGDVGSGDCINCITNATVELRNRCPNQNEAIIWYDSCMFRYANRPSFGVQENSPSFYMWNINNVTDVDAFNQALGTLMDRLTNNASSGTSLGQFATGSARVSASQTVYGLVQCTPDLTRVQCSSCLSQNIGNIPSCCDRKQGGRVIGPSCNLRLRLHASIMEILLIHQYRHHRQQHPHYLLQHHLLSPFVGQKELSILLPASLKTTLTAFSTGSSMAKEVLMVFSLTIQWGKT
ncbi:hypothetical protein PTKIN_Ptkin18bG0138700 [Pterospermum kingtungense]